MSADDNDTSCRCCVLVQYHGVPGEVYNLMCQDTGSAWILEVPERGVRTMSAGFLDEIPLPEDLVCLDAWTPGA